MSQLSEIANVIGGYAFKSEDFSSSGVPVAKIANIEPPRVNLEGCDFIQEEKLKNLDRFRLSKGDILMAMTGATIGKVGRFRDSQPAYLNQRVAKISSKFGDQYNDFLFVLLSQKGFEEKILNNSSGSAQANISADGIGRVLIPEIPFHQQLIIGKIMAAIDDKMELNRQTNQTLEEMAQSLFKSWFVDFDPVHAKSQGRQPEGMDPATAALFPSEFTDSELGPIPKGWEVRALDEVANYLNGLALQKFPPESHSEWLPVIKIAQLKKGDTSGADKASSALKPEYIVNDGDVLFSWSGSLEVDIWCGGKGALNQHLFKVTSEEFPKWFFYHWTKHHLKSFQAIASAKAVTMGHIQRKHLTEAKCIAPTAELLARLGDHMEPLLEEQVALRLQARTLSEVRDKLLPRLLSGELSVSGAGES